MDKLEAPLTKIAAAFAVVMAGLGIYAAFKMDGDPKVIFAVVLGLIMTVIALVGVKKDSPYMVAGGALGAGMLFPTTLGIWPMIAGFVIFTLVVTLRLFNSLSE